MTDENKSLEKTPVVGIQQLNLSYDKVQDRLLFKVGLSDDTEVALWFTYRFSLELWAALNEEAHLPVAESFKTAEVNGAIEQFQQEVEATEALAKMDFQTAYQSQDTSRNDSVMLAVGFKLSDDAKHLDIECLEGLAVNINLTPELLLAICSMLQLATKEAGWVMKMPVSSYVMHESSVSKVLH
ncbi:MAG TPA: hypothetical protein VLM20_08080 [Methylophilaceae bacterium]|nr:hypothetical protein [Methylophilaceae bacterium]